MPIATAAFYGCIEIEIYFLIPCFEFLDQRLDAIVAKLSKSLDDRCVLEFPFLHPFGKEGLTEQSIDLRTRFNELDICKPGLAWSLPEKVGAEVDWLRLPGDRHLDNVFDDDRHR